MLDLIIALINALPFQSCEHHTWCIILIPSLGYHRSLLDCPRHQIPLFDEAMQDLPFTAIGFLFCLHHLRNILDFIWFYFLRPTDTHKRYLTGPHPHALITGATDGIGKALAKELYYKGFNLIIHGRNEGKILSVIDELRKNSSSSGDGDVKYFLADANRDDVDFEAIAKRV